MAKKKWNEETTRKKTLGWYRLSKKILKKLSGSRMDLDTQS